MKKRIFTVLFLILLFNGSIVIAKEVDEINPTEVITITSTTENESAADEISFILENTLKENQTLSQESIYKIVELSQKGVAVNLPLDLMENIEKNNPMLAKSIEDLSGNIILDQQNTVNLLSAREKRHCFQTPRWQLNTKILGHKGNCFAKVKCDVEWWYWTDSGVITNVLPKTTIYDKKYNATGSIISSSGKFNKNSTVYNHEITIHGEYGYDLNRTEYLTSLGFKIIGNKLGFWIN